MQQATTITSSEPLRRVNSLLRQPIALVRGALSQAGLFRLSLRQEALIRDIKKLSTAGRPATVRFVVTQRQLWGVQSLYDAFRADDRFDTRIIAMPNTEDKGADPFDTARDNLRYFEQQNTEVLLGIEPSGKLKRPEELFQFPNVCFLDQPWLGLAEPWTLATLARHSLICYVPYGFKIANVSQFHFNHKLHNMSWRVFAETEWHRDQFISLGRRRGRNVVVSGYPKFDEYLGARARAMPSKSTKMIIWAPHWSIRDRVLGYSTFDRFHAYFVGRAAANRQVDWVFKPHQKLRYHALECGFMTEAEIDAYYKAWAEGGNTRLFDDPGYMNLFESSSALITDSGSFLAEYLPTGKPVLLLQSDASVGYNSFGQSIVDSYYKARTEGDIDAFIDHVVLQGDDPLKSSRSRLISQVMRTDGVSSGQFIKDHIAGALGLK